MSIVLAPDSFKGTLTQFEAADAMARGLRRRWPELATVRCPMADGGEGTAAVLAAARGGRFIEAATVDAYGRPRAGRFLLLPDRIAVIEAAAGPGYLRSDARPGPARRAHSRGLGLLIRAAVREGARRLVVTLGGTGSSDGGMGTLLELGARIAGAGEPGAAALSAVTAIELVRLPIPLEVWVDVLPPLTGPRGAIRAYGPQKGLLAGELDELDAAMERYGEILDRAAGKPVSETAGAGAAGGLGAALAAVGGRLVQGGVAVAEAVGLPAAIKDARAVFTGEGAVDAQSGDGKVVSVVCRLARNAGVPALVVAGRLAGGGGPLYGDGASAFFAVTPGHDRPGAASEAADRLERRLWELSRWLDPMVAPRYGVPGR